GATDRYVGQEHGTRLFPGYREPRAPPPGPAPPPPPPPPRRPPAPANRTCIPSPSIPTLPTTTRSPAPSPLTICTSPCTSSVSPWVTWATGSLPAAMR